jgi:cation:H+ antiporter
MILPIVFILLGFALLIKGADWMITGASTLAKKNNISDLAIGLTIVAFGTSAPELVVNAIAAFENHPNMIFGNVIGSNNFNLFVILGIVGLIFPIAVQSSTVWKEIPISFIAIVVVYLLANTFLASSSSLSRSDGFILLALFLGFLIYVYSQMKTDVSDSSITEHDLSNLKIGVLIILGLAGLVSGGQLVVNNAIKLASTLGVSEKIISLTIVAVGTSLPELVTSVLAATKKKSDLAIGNIIGSNIFNLFFILSVSSIIRPITYQPAFNTDLFLLAGGTIFLFVAMFTGKRKKLDRWEAALLLLVFVVYTVYLIQKEL